ncbi:MAG: helix-turn-helix transcriptional regulator [Chloroflexota bacterium]
MSKGGDLCKHPQTGRRIRPEGIRKARLEKGMRQVDVARVIGVDEMTMVNWERRETTPLLRQMKIKRLCDFLRIDFR